MYERYAHYPEYCSTPDEMERRSVPPLMKTEGGTGGGFDTKLVHVTALIRHGARTPYASALGGYKCWNDFWTNAETGIWNCHLNTLMSPPVDFRTVDEESNNPYRNFAEPDFIFEKFYDALTLPLDSNVDGISRTGNELNGTCQKGQLLLRGYDQELRNGLHLRQAYFYDGENTKEGEHAASDVRMRLWDLTTGPQSDNGADNNPASSAIGDPAAKPYHEPNLHYRADDGQRTLMSGQILLRGLFGPELSASDDTVIRLHTADYKLDVLGFQEKQCDKLKDLRLEAEQSEEYVRLTETGAEVRSLTAFLGRELEMEEIPNSILDCLMTTVCTDRALPPPLDDYNGTLGSTGWEPDQDPTYASSGSSKRSNTVLENANVAVSAVGDGDLRATAARNVQDGNGDGGSEKNIFERLINISVKKFNFRYKYNDAAYAKLEMGPIWKEIMDNIRPIVDPSSSTLTSTGGADDNTNPPPPKLALFSGHDTTLMPVLATLGPQVWSGTEWAPYASMILIEIHEIVPSTTDDGSELYPSGYAFRLIYNGQTLTSKMDNCPDDSEFCDSHVLVQQVTPFAKYADRDCASTVTDANSDEGGDSDDGGGGPEEEVKKLISTKGGVAVVVVVVILSAAIGSLVTFMVMRHHGRKGHGYGETVSVQELSLADVSENEGGVRNGAVDTGAAAAEDSTVYGSTNGGLADENRLI